MEKSLCIYYFSGTGNARNVAQIIEREVWRHNVAVQINDISKTDRLHIKSPQSNELLVLVSPVHGFNYPPIMLHYLLRFPKGNNEVMLMNTRAGMRIGNWVTPGISGISLYLSALILLCKGYKIQSLYPVDFPSNWISLHPALNKKTIDFIYHQVTPKIEKAARGFLNGKREFTCVRECIIDLLVVPIAILYYFIGRFVIAKTFYASQDCTKCGLCERNCAIHAIKTVNGKPFWTFQCESCMNCMNNCPQKAIETAHGFIIVIAIAFSILVSSVFDRYLPVITDSKWLKFLLENMLFIAYIAVFYRLLHFMLRFRWFERMVVFTSLTKLSFWGRYKAPKQ